MEGLVKPESIAGLNKLSGEDIAAFNEEVLKADCELTRITQDLQDLNDSLYQLEQSKKEYDEKAGWVKSRMRSLLGKL